MNEANVRDLIDSILSEGGQKVPVVVRRVEGDSAYDYEVIAGTRQHFASSWLRCHSYPEVRLLAQVADLGEVDYVAHMFPCLRPGTAPSQ